MFNVTYNNMIDVRVDAIQFLHLLELYAAGIDIKALKADYQGKSIDCNKLLHSLRFV